MTRIVSIVEGHGELDAVPILLRRIAAAALPAGAVDVRSPIRVDRRKIVKAAELERAVELAARKAGAGGRILILLDAEDDCPAELAPDLLRRARAARGDRAIRVVLAKTEYEAWFLAAADSIVSSDPPSGHVDDHFRHRRRTAVGAVVRQAVARRDGTAETRRRAAGEAGLTLLRDLIDGTEPARRR